MSRGPWALVVAVVACAAGCADPAVSAQERVRLRATHPDGVPVHAEPGNTPTTARLPDGSEVDVVRWREDRRWLEVRGASGDRGWISARYLDRGPTPLPEPWRTRAACEASPRPTRAAGRLRIATWNLRWFPDGSSQGSADHPTDVDWMACAIASLGVDAVAVQEVMLHPRGVAAVERLTARLSALGGGRWRNAFDPCPRDGRQHVGFLWDVTRVRLEDVRALDDVNPLGGCTGRLRPGLSATVRAGARSVSAIVVHLDSGTEARDRTHRDQSVEALAARAPQLGDAIVLGDFNTMGGAGTDGPAERIALDTRFLRAGWRRPTGEVACSEVYRGHGVLLDHAFVSARLARGATVEPAGFCATSCQLTRGQDVEALESLSDHCPVVVEVALQ